MNLSLIATALVAIAASVVAQPPGQPPLINLQLPPLRPEPPPDDHKGLPTLQPGGSDLLPHPSAQPPWTHGGWQPHPHQQRAQHPQQYLLHPNQPSPPHIQVAPHPPLTATHQGGHHLNQPQVLPHPLAHHGGGQPYPGHHGNPRQAYPQQYPPSAHLNQPSPPHNQVSPHPPLTATHQSGHHLRPPGAPPLHGPPPPVWREIRPALPSGWTPHERHGEVVELYEDVKRALTNALHSTRRLRNREKYQEWYNAAEEHCRTHNEVLAGKQPPWSNRDLNVAIMDAQQARNRALIAELSESPEAHRKRRRQEDESRQRMAELRRARTHR